MATQQNPESMVSMPPFGILIPGTEVKYNFEQFGDKG